MELCTLAESAHADRAGHGPPYFFSLPADRPRCPAAVTVSARLDKNLVDYLEVRHIWDTNATQCGK
jgi:hypothetical protein